MATQTILRRRGAVVNALSQPSISYRCFSSFELGQSPSTPSSGNSNLSVALPSLDSDSKRERESSLGNKDKLQLLTSSAGLLRKDFGGSPAIRPVNARLYYGSSFGATWLSQGLRHSSTAAGQPNGKNEEKVGSQNKEVSPEEGDQAVEGVSSPKAKAKDTMVQKTQKAIHRKFWAKILGLGGART